MSDDSFIREVDEELRQDQFKSLWDRFGAYILGGAILVVLVTAAVVAYRYWDETRANAAGDKFASSRAWRRAAATAPARVSAAPTW